MGYDITLHPIKKEEYKFFIEDIVNNAHLVDERLAVIHEEENERNFLYESIYSRFPELIQGIKNGNLQFETSLGFASGTILSYLHPFWYLRNGVLS